MKLPSPSKVLDTQRSGVRLSVPQGQDRELVKQIVEARDTLPCWFILS